MAGVVITRRYGPLFGPIGPRLTAAFLGSEPPGCPGLARPGPLPCRHLAYLAYLGAQVGGGQISAHQHPPAAVPGGHSENGNFWKLHRGVNSM